MPHGYDEEEEDHLAMIYYSDHDVLDDNEIKIVSKKGQAYEVQWTGTTKDVNHYDESSKPKTRENRGKVYAAEKHAKETPDPLPNRSYAAANRPQRSSGNPTNSTTLVRGAGY